jgi:hypothetical protein
MRIKNEDRGTASNEGPLRPFNNPLQTGSFRPAADTQSAPWLRTAKAAESQYTRHKQAHNLELVSYVFAGAFDAELSAHNLSAR